MALSRGRMYPLRSDANTNSMLAREPDNDRLEHDVPQSLRAVFLRPWISCVVDMAPAMVIGQLCEVVDLDGPLLQSEDWPDGITYRNGTMSVPARTLWG